MCGQFDIDTVTSMIYMKRYYCIHYPISSARLAIDRSISILTRPVVITGFNRSLLVDWLSIGRLKKTWLMCRYLALYIPCFTELCIDYK